MPYLVQIHAAFGPANTEEDSQKWPGSEHVRPVGKNRLGRNRNLSHPLQALPVQYGALSRLCVRNGDQGRKWDNPPFVFRLNLFSWQLAGKAMSRWVTTPSSRKNVASHHAMQAELLRTVL